MDYTPVPHVLRSFAHQSNINWVTALAELIDNSFDANATRVAVSYGDRKVIVEDDGVGIKDISCIGKLGAHSQHATTALGVYGVGLKAAWLYAGSTMTVDTTRNGVTTRLHVDPEQIAANNWQGDDPTTEQTGKPSGTTITLPLSKERRYGPDKGTMESLAWHFTPALEAGRQITFRNSKQSRKAPLTAWKLPKFIDSVRDEFVVGSKRVAIDIGIVADGDMMKRGPFWITYKHRIIERAAIGANGYSTMRMGGVIRLLDGWTFSTNKDSLASCVEELEDAIHERIKMLLMKASQLSEDIEAAALKTELEGMLNDGIGQYKKEQRPGKVGCSGPKAPIPRNSGTRRRRAKVIQEGDGSVEVNASTTRRRGFKIDWCHDDADKVGEFDSLANIVRLNLKNGFVATAKASQNLPALYATAIAILADYCCNHDRHNEKLLIPLGDFSLTFGSILNSLQTKEVNNGQKVIS